MSSSWGSKLQAKLSNINDTSQRESIQTVAKWIAFNRKHAAAFCECLRSEFLGKQAVLLNLINEIMIQEEGTAKWDRLAPLRLALGEFLIEIAPQLSKESKDTLENYMEEWDDISTLSGTTILDQMKRALRTKIDAGEEQTKEAPLVVDGQLKPPPPSPLVKATSAAKSEDSVVAPILASKKLVTLAPVEVEYDFESKGIPAETVEHKEFVEPSRQIASLQIARDVRNDAAIQLWSRLSALPEDIRKVYSEVAEGVELSQEQARDFANRMDSALINADLDEHLQSIRLLRDIVQRQRRARAELWRMLVRSRCEFGSNKAAEAFLKADRSKEELLERKQILTDAMELEGLDVAAESKPKEPAHNVDLSPLTWYRPEGGDDPEAKRQRTE
jgi:hypothetical protein